MVYIGTNKYKYGRMVMSHMVADTLYELHNMADVIGVDRKYFQDKNNIPHYDISKKKVTLALKLGAKLISDREIVNHPTTKDGWAS